MKKVLVTGGAGFIGFHLSQRLAQQEYRVTILDNLAREYAGDSELESLLAMDSVRLIRGDITCRKTFDDIPCDFDSVYHLAAINGTGNFYSIPDEVLKVGTLGTINLLEWAKQNRETKILYSSSSEAYAGTLGLLGDKFPIPTPEDVPLVIDNPSNVRWSYAVGKILGEVAFGCYAKAHGLTNFVIIRYHNVYGPRMGFSHVLPQFIERIVQAEDPFQIFGGDETRAFCYVGDAIEATQFLMESDLTRGETYHVGRDEEISITEFAETLFDIAGVAPETVQRPAFEGSVKRRGPNCDKLAKLGYVAQTELRTGLQHSFEWYRSKF